MEPKSSNNNYRDTRRRLLLGAAALSVGGGMLPAAGAWAAEKYPSRPVRFIIPFPPGTGTDNAARMFAKAFTEYTGQQVVVENKPGGNGFIAVTSVLNSPVDGYTVFIGSNSTLSTNAAVFKKIPYDPLKDFTPISVMIQGPCLVVVPKNSPFKTLQDLAAAAKQRPEALNYGSGSMSYTLNTEWLNQMLGIKATSIPYKGANEALLATISGEVDYAVVDSTSGTPQVKGGHVRALVYSGESRSKSLPDVPTSAEAGVQGYLAYNWVAAAVASKTPPEISAAIRVIFQALANNAGLQKYYETQTSSLILSSPEKMLSYQKDEITRWTALMKQVGIQAQ